MSEVEVVNIIGSGAEFDPRRADVPEGTNWICLQENEGTMTIEILSEA